MTSILSIRAILFLHFADDIILAMNEMAVVFICAACKIMSFVDHMDP